MEIIDLNKQNNNSSSALIDYERVVLQRHNNGIGDVIMSLPIFSALPQSANKTLYFSMLDVYNIILEDNPDCQPYYQEDVDVIIKFDDYFENNNDGIHRTDMLAEGLGIKLQNKKPVIHKKDFSWHNTHLHVNFFNHDYGLVFPCSQNIFRNLSQSILNEMSKISDIPLYYMEQKCIMIDGSIYDTTLEDLFFLIKHSKICLGVDSGPMHIAGAMGIPFLVFCNVIDPEYRYKYYDNWSAIRTNLLLDCVYACDHHCPYDYRPPCLRFFDWTMIEDKFTSLLGVE